MTIQEQKFFILLSGHEMVLIKLLGYKLFQIIFIKTWFRPTDKWTDVLYLRFKTKKQNAFIS